MRSKKRVNYLIIGLILFLVLYVFLFLFSLNKTTQKSEKLLINDVSRLNPTYINKIVKNEEVEGLQDALSEARKDNLKVSIAGKKHSMGGHTFYKDAVVLDMTSFNKILSINTKDKIITVQSGVTWKDIIEYVNSYNLSVEVMQGYNSFTVGGSMSVNVHESDPNYGSLIETIESFRLLLANGTIVNVSRTENSELFSLVNGGYGLFGVILDADIRLTDNGIYQKKEYLINYTDYPTLFKSIRKNNSDLKIIYARLSVAKDDSLLNELVATTYSSTHIKNQSYLSLQPNKNVALKKFIFGLSRKYDWGKKFRWYLQKEYTNLEFPEIVSRNNLMNADPSFLNYYSSRNTDILQEYFVPVENLPEFIDKLKETVKDNDLNLLSITIRYIPENNESFLAYSDKENKFGAVLYFNVGLSEKEQEKVKHWTQELINDSLNLNGTYYLPYELYASQDQIREAYPSFDEFCNKKLKYDPQQLFMNQFYAKYCLGEENYEGN